MPGPDFGPTLYDQLGVPRDADEQTLKRAWRAQLRATHPDTTGVDSHVQYDLVQRAWEVLGDPARRTAYDAWLDSREAPEPEPAHDVQPDEPGGAPLEQTEPVHDEPEPSRPGARLTAVIVALGMLATAAGVLLPHLAGADPQERQAVLLAAAVLVGIGSWTWRTAGWRPKAMLVALGVCAALGGLLYLSSTLPGSDTARPLAVPVGMLLVVLGTGVTTWRLAARRRSKYVWDFGA